MELDETEDQDPEPDSARVPEQADPEQQFSELRCLRGVIYARLRDLECRLEYSDASSI